MQSSKGNVNEMIDGWIVQLRKGALEYCLMLVLRRGESYGYEIIQALAEVEDLSVGESTVYPILARLKAEGLLKARLGRSGAGPMRRYFSREIGVPVVNYGICLAAASRVSIGAGGRA